MKSHPTAIIIGAGLGGIAAAGRLARQGYQVKVIEKNSLPGGRCSQLKSDGHRFDIGATLLLMPEIFAETYAALGERMQDHLDLRRIDPTYTLNFKDGSQLALSGDLPAMQDRLEAIQRGSFDGFLRYLVEGSLHYHQSVDHFVGRNFHNLAEFLSPKNLLLVLRIKGFAKHYNNIGHYFTHPRLKAAFTFQNMYLGLSPFDAPATYSLLQYTELADGVWFPMGGLYQVITSLVSIAEKLGVEFYYNSPVESIEVEGDRAKGVILQDGARLAADVIIANPDLPYVYESLLPDRAPARRLERKKYTCSAIMFYWGSDKVFPQLEHHNIFLSDDYRPSFDSIFRDHSLPDEPSFYVHAPARTDPAAAPQGQDTLLVLVPCGHIVPGASQDWASLKAKARAFVIKRLAEKGMPDLEQHLKFELSYTPEDWAGQFNCAKGSAFGLSHNVWQVGYFRPHNRHPQYHNLFFVGGSTHPGTGLPMVLLSAKLTTERILESSVI
jgi:phytoene desaturase